MKKNYKEADHNLSSQHANEGRVFEDDGLTEDPTIGVDNDNFLNPYNPPRTPLPALGEALVFD